MSEKYNHLYDFLYRRMRMTHIYQPVMLIQLLSSGGRATVTDIAKAILVHDPTQVEYYEAITKRYPGRVLTHSHSLTERRGDTFHLNGFDGLSNDEVSKLIKACMERLDHFLKRKVTDPWNHRRRSLGYISGSTKYEVLKRARYRCQLCGVSAEHRALEVDHIVPRKFSGGNDISNLQALCYSCNSMKRDSDDSDFRDVAERYHDREANCVFCDPTIAMVTSQNELSYAALDEAPVTTGHTLVIPRRHVANYFDLYQPELNSIQQNLDARRRALLESDDSITGFNVGFDSGSDAGQTVLHCCLHLIPRRKDDWYSRRGGLRDVIPMR